LKHLILLSGRIASGKSSLATKLIDFYGGHLFKTNEVLKKVAEREGKPLERTKLQKLGEKKDRDTKGTWVVDELQTLLDQLHASSEGLPEVVVVDSVRILEQIDAFRKAYGNKVLHIHLDADESELAKRYADRDNTIAEISNYKDLSKNKTERGVPKLAGKADVLISTDRCTHEDVFVRASAQLRIHDHTVIPLVDVLVGGQYGSEGKGNVVAHIAPEYKYLVRVGGPNAGHKVYGEPVRTFRHLPSGTEHAPNAHIILGPGAVINPEVLMQEIAFCSLSFDRLSIDPNAMIIEQRDIDGEKKELTKNISSTGQGVGLATARKITDRGNKKDPVRTAKDIDLLKPYIRKTGPILEKAYAKLEPVLLEGTQGTSLSLHHGPYPTVTSRDTTVAGCLAEAGISPRRVRKVILVCRTYPIRVSGKQSGPMSKEIEYQEIADRSGMPLDEITNTEVTSTTHKQRRIAEFDWEQLHQSIVLNAPTDIALTFVDYLDVNNQDARRFEQLTPETIRFIEEIERVSKAPVSLISTRFHYRSIIDRRAW
jgi:adenylosuccinate synthase